MYEMKVIQLVIERPIANAFFGEAHTVDGRVWAARKSQDDVLP